MKNTGGPFGFVNLTVKADVAVPSSGPVVGKFSGLLRRLESASRVCFLMASGGFGGLGAGSRKRCELTRS